MCPQNRYPKNCVLAIRYPRDDVRNVLLFRLLFNLLNPLAHNKDFFIPLGLFNCVDDFNITNHIQSCLITFVHANNAGMLYHPYVLVSTIGYVSIICVFDLVPLTSQADGAATRSK